MINLSNLKRHILYDSTKITKKLKTQKKHVKIRAFSLKFW